MINNSFFIIFKGHIKLYSLFFPPFLVCSIWLLLLNLKDNVLVCKILGSPFISLEFMISLSYTVEMFDASLNFTLVGNLVSLLMCPWYFMTVKLGVGGYVGRGEVVMGRWVSIT